MYLDLCLVSKVQWENRALLGCGSLSHMTDTALPSVPSQLPAPWHLAPPPTSPCHLGSPLPRVESIMLVARPLFCCPLSTCKCGSVPRETFFGPRPDGEISWGSTRHCGQHSSPWGREMTCSPSAGMWLSVYQLRGS